MAPVTREKKRAAVVLHRRGQTDSDSEEEVYSSSSDDDTEEEEEDDNENKQGVSAAASGETSSAASALPPKSKIKNNTATTTTPPITITLNKVCKVCKRTGHLAGFKGATYIDCPMKPCFLCKIPGHTTMTCPHRVAMEHGVIPAPRRNTRRTPLDYIFERQLKAKALPMIKPAYVIPDQVDCGIIRFHSRRVTCLEFHPTRDNVLLSGDKKGQIGIWDYDKVHEKTVYGSIHSCIVNNMKFRAENGESVYTSSSDGTISHTDLETVLPLLLMNLNPDGWSVIILHWNLI